MRPAQAQLFSGDVWRERAGSWVAGGAVAAVSVGFAKLVDAATVVLHMALAKAFWLPLVATPVAFTVLAAVTMRYFPAAAGSGIPNAMAALKAQSATTLERLFDLKMIVARIALSATAILFGASVGREGPTVHVGAAVAYRFGRWIPRYAAPLQRRTLVLAGGAAGIAAAFNTPLAGIVFAIEELARSYETRASGTTLVAVLIAGVVSLALVGDYTYFGHPVLPAAAGELFLPAAGIGIVGGLLGGLFSMLLLRFSSDTGPMAAFRRNRPMTFAFSCGMAVAVAGVLSGGSAFGTGYEPARAVLEGGTTSLGFVPAKFIATLASQMAGIPGGLFAPCLAVGAGLGQLAANLPGMPVVSGLAILGTCAFLTGVTQAPMTAFIIVMEMTGLHQLVLPLMVVALFSSTASRMLSPSLYHELADRLLDEDAVLAAPVPPPADAKPAGGSGPG